MFPSLQVANSHNWQGGQVHIAPTVYMIAFKKAPQFCFNSQDRVLCSDRNNWLTVIFQAGSPEQGNQKVHSQCDSLDILPNYNYQTKLYWLIKSEIREECVPLFSLFFCSKYASLFSGKEKMAVNRRGKTDLHPLTSSDENQQTYSTINGVDKNQNGSIKSELPLNGEFLCIN